MVFTEDELDCESGRVVAVAVKKRLRNLDCDPRPSLPGIAASIGLDVFKAAVEFVQPRYESLLNLCRLEPRAEDGLRIAALEATISRVSKVAMNCEVAGRTPNHPNGARYAAACIEAAVAINVALAGGAVTPEEPKSRASVMDKQRYGALAAEFEKLSNEAEKGPWCDALVNAQIRHVERNCDVDCPEHVGYDVSCAGSFGRYDGSFVAWCGNNRDLILAALQHAAGISVGVDETTPLSSVLNDPDANRAVSSEPIA